MFGNFTTLCMKGLNSFNIRNRIWRRSLSWLPTSFLSYFIRQHHGVVSYWFVFLYQITTNNSKLSNIYIISYIGFNTNLNFCKKSQFSMKRLDNKSSNNDLSKKLCILCSTDSGWGRYVLTSMKLLIFSSKILKFVIEISVSSCSRE